MAKTKKVPLNVGKYSPLSFPPPLSWCNVCGALVGNRTVHNTWHANNP